jgi:hypothetical protein
MKQRSIRSLCLPYEQRQGRPSDGSASSSSSHTGRASVPIPKRSKALRAASKNFRGPSGIQHAAVLAAAKAKPSGRRKGACLDRHCARQPRFCARPGRRNDHGRTKEWVTALYLQGEHNYGWRGSRLTSAGRIEKLRKSAERRTGTPAGRYPGSLVTRLGIEPAPPKATGL